MNRWISETEPQLQAEPGNSNRILSGSTRLEFSSGSLWASDTCSSVTSDLGPRTRTGTARQNSCLGAVFSASGPAARSHQLPPTAGLKEQLAEPQQLVLWARCENIHIPVRPGGCRTDLPALQQTLLSLVLLPGLRLVSGWRPQREFCPGSAELLCFTF